MVTGIGVHLILGLGVIGGVLSAMLFKRFSAPQVMGYIAAGILLGQTGLKVVDAHAIQQLNPFNMFTLGLIGFLVGSELRFDIMRKYARQFTAILLGEGVTAFVLVGLSTGVVLYLVSGSVATAVAGGVVFGAVASATDPASTINVLWEYRCAGVLTLTLTAIVALDDALAMSLYGLGSGIAQIVTGGSVNMMAELGKITLEIPGSIALGIVGGLFSTLVLRRSQNQENVMTAAVGLLLLCIGIGILEDMDIILIAMSFGITIVNMSPERSKSFVELIRRISPPFYVMFFVLVGARLHFGAMPGWLWILVGLYVVFRSLGKIGGAWFGARIMHSEPVVQNLTGIGLMAQGGVAIGLSVMASQRLSGVNIAPGLALADVLVFTITATTFIVQVIGPPLVKLAAHRAGETGRNITEQDVVEEMTVADVIVRDIPSVGPNSTLQQVMDAYTNSNAAFVPVLDNSGELAGMIGNEELRSILLEQSVWVWMLAADILIPPKTVLQADMKLSEALQTLDRLGSDQLPVVDPDTGRVTAILDRAVTRNKVKHTLVTRQAERVKSES